MYCPTTTTNPRTFINNKYRVMEFESIYNLLPKENIVAKKKSQLKKSEDASEEKVLIGSTFGKIFPFRVTNLSLTEPIIHRMQWNN